MIEVKNLTKAYGNFVAVKDVSFKAENGSILGFLGPNGAGKTTTMRIITGYMPATAGTVLIDGLDIFSQSLEARRKIGYLPENPPLYPDMRVEAYLRFVATSRARNSTPHSSTCSKYAGSRTCRIGFADSSRRAIASAWAWRRR
jgi:ABC-2 type transport system ATP-binding protein